LLSKEKGSMALVKKEEKELFVKWFSELGRGSLPVAGGKGANLAEMANMGLPVPPGFAVTAGAYHYYIEKTGLKETVARIIKEIQFEDTAELHEGSRIIQELIVKAKMPEEMQEEILEAYEALSTDKDALSKASSDVLTILRNSYEPMFVAVRSSATAEDLADASFAGQQETFLNVKGNVALITAVKKCFASLFTARAMYYRHKKKFDQDKVLISAIVQQMVNADKSGVIFSKDPLSGSEDIVIEAVFGLGEGIVSGRIIPDHYKVSRNDKILSVEIAEKKIAVVRNSAGETVEISLNEDKRKQQVLIEYEIKKLADYALKLEEHFGKPQDIEFAIDSKKMYLVQTRPITTLEMKKEKEEISGKFLLQGNPASPGIGSGIVKIIYDMKDLEKIKQGDVLVTKMTNPDMVVSMQKAAAILTDEGGITSHAAIVSREMGIPAVVGAKRATTLLKDGMQITVDGFTGKVYEGIAQRVEIQILPVVPTRTKMKIIVDLPDYAARAAKTQCKSVGLVRLEGIIAESGKHPQWYLNEGKINEYTQVIARGISKIAEHFEELWVRTSDIRSDEYEHLEGSPPGKEANPMLGMHGIRYSLKKRNLLKAEILALKKVADTGKKVGLMMPQVISVEEFLGVKEMIEELGISNIIIGVMVETPAAAWIIEDLCNAGISFISFGTNDLTQYTLAIDRGNEAVQYLYNEMHPAVLAQIKHVIEVCKKHHVETSICGQAASRKEMAEFLVKAGIDSISVNADVAGEISKVVADAEKSIGAETLEHTSEPLIQIKRDEQRLFTEAEAGSEMAKEMSQKKVEPVIRLEKPLEMGMITPNQAPETDKEKEKMEERVKEIPL